MTDQDEALGAEIDAIMNELENLQNSLDQDAAPPVEKPKSNEVQKLKVKKPEPAPTVETREVKKSPEPIAESTPSLIDQAIEESSEYPAPVIPIHTLKSDGLTLNVSGDIQLQMTYGVHDQQVSISVENAHFVVRMTNGVEFKMPIAETSKKNKQVA